MRNATLLLLSALVIAGAASAQSRDPSFLCTSRHTAEAIAACTAIIRDSLQPPEDRVVALRNRGYTYQLTGDLDRAIVDYDAAVKLALAEGKHPKGRAATLLAKTYVDRGVAWRAKGEVDKALADFDAALAADPNLVSAQENRDALFFQSK
jgi:tetratricopeptide (TPR) repeat protein